MRDEYSIPLEELLVGWPALSEVYQPIPITYEYHRVIPTC